MCRQTFSGHESDINAIGVSFDLAQFHRGFLDGLNMFFFFCVLFLFLCVPVFPQRLRFRNWIGWRHLSFVWHPSRPRAGHVFARQHHMRHHICCVFQIWPSPIGWLRRFQLQRVGLYEDRTSRYARLTAADCVFLGFFFITCELCCDPVFLLLFCLVLLQVC